MVMAEHPNYSQMVLESGKVWDMYQVIHGSKNLMVLRLNGRRFRVQIEQNSLQAQNSFQALPADFKMEIKIV